MTRRIFAASSAGLLGLGWPRADAAFAVAALMTVAFAPSARAEQKVFNVPEQSLETALRQLADQAGVTTLFDPAVTAGRSSRPVEGRFATLDAFGLVLDGHNLEAVAIGDRTIVVRPRRSVRPARSKTVANDVFPTARADEIVVTGQRDGGAMRRSEASFAITVTDAAHLQLQQPRGLADVVSNTPGFWVEASGGEASNNVRARGVPLDGYASIAALENGLPLQHDPGLGFLNVDQSLRLDLAVDRVEVVRGGPAAILASNAPGGLVNIVIKRPPEMPAATTSFQITDSGGLRADFWAGRPLGEWRVAISGFYREDAGVRDPGYSALSGGQARIDVERRTERGALQLSLKRIDDQVPFYLPLPLQLAADGSVDRLRGFDPLRGTLLGPDTAALQYDLPTDLGAPRFRLEEGTHTRLTDAKVTGAWDVAPNLRSIAAMRVRQSDTARSGLFPRSPQTASSRLSSSLPGLLQQFHSATRAELRYTSDGRPFDPIQENGNGLVIDAIASAVEAPLDETIWDIRLEGAAGRDGSVHEFRVGFYGAEVSTGLRRTASTVLLDVRERAQRLDLVALDASGAEVGALTDSGILRYGAQFDNAVGSQSALAVFLSDTWRIGDNLRVDAGARWERSRLTGSVEGVVSRDLGDSTTLADDAVLQGSGKRTPFAGEFAAWNWTLGLSRTLGVNLSAFARLTASTRLPSVSAYYSDVSGARAFAAPMRSFDAGVNYTDGRFSFYPVIFVSRFNGYPFEETIVDPASGQLRSRTAFARSETLGLEVEAEARPTDYLRLGLGVTAQDPRFETFRFQNSVSGTLVSYDYSGNQLVRVPRVMARFSPVIHTGDDRAELRLEIEHYGSRFADAANTVRLPAFTSVNAHLRVSIGDRARLSLTVENVTNTLGLTEGNPRSGQFLSADANERYFSARPIFGRTARAALTWEF